MKYYKKSGSYSKDEVEECVSCPNKINTQLDNYIELHHHPDRNDAMIPVFIKTFGVMCPDCFYKLTNLSPENIMGGIKLRNSV